MDAYQLKECEVLAEKAQRLAFLLINPPVEGNYDWTVEVNALVDYLHSWTYQVTLPPHQKTRVGETRIKGSDHFRSAHDEYEPDPK